MKSKTVQFFFLLILLFSLNNISAQNEKEVHSENISNNSKDFTINFSPFGWFLKDQYWFSLNLERLTWPSIGLGGVAELTYSSNKSNNNLSAYNLELNTQLRYHFNHRIDGFYTSLFVKWGWGSADGTLSYTNGYQENFKVRTTYMSGGLNVGYRFLFSNNWNLNIRIGYGGTVLNLNSDKINSDIEKTVKDYGNSIDKLIAYDGEFSFGYAF